jgi:hypothetical protein
MLSSPRNIAQQGERDVDYAYQFGVKGAEWRVAEWLEICGSVVALYHTADLMVGRSPYTNII